MRILIVVHILANSIDRVMLVFAKSLKAYRERFNPRFVICTAMTGLRTDDGLVNLPLFALPSFAHVIRTDREG